MEKYNKLLVRGIGVKGAKYPTKNGKKILKEYDLWNKMLERCTEKHWEEYPTYFGTNVSENFKSYSYFYEWCQEQIGFGNTDENGRSWHLDKDILVKGNKLYSEDTCVFVPAIVNGLLVKCNASRGEWPIGVSLSKQHGNYKSVCSIGKGESIFLGRYITPQDAFEAYKSCKENHIKQVAEQYKGQIDPRAYEALMNYTVEITD